MIWHLENWRRGRTLNNEQIKTQTICMAVDARTNKQAEYVKSKSNIK